MEDKELFENIYSNAAASRQSLNEATFDLLDQIADNFFAKEDELLSNVEGENA